MHLKQDASEISANYTLSRISADVRASLTPEQLSAIRKALIDQSSIDRRRFDLRFTIPLFFRTYYCVFLLGKDRRRSTYERETRRIEAMPKPIRSFIFASIASVVFFSYGLLILTALYLLKSALGIDLFAEFHLRDLMSFFLHTIDPVR